MRLAYNQAGDEAPFWGLPFVRLCGVPVFRYLGRYLLTAEVEPRKAQTPDDRAAGSSV